MQPKRSSAVSFVYLTILAMLISIPVGVLSIFNFGLICRAYNGAIAVLTLVFGAIFLLFFRRERRQKKKSEEAPEIRIVFPRNDLPDLQEMIKEPTPDSANEFSAAASLFGATFEPIDFPLANTMYILFLALGIAVAYIVGFAIMTDITMRGGVNSTHPAERAPGMTYPWNIQIQIAQTVLMGLEMLVMLVFVISSFMGRVGVVEDEKEAREVVDYGLEA